MTATTMICQTSTHSVRLRLDEKVTIDLGSHPDYPRIVPVTELAVIYETTKKLDSDSVTIVTGISYVLDDEEDKAAFVHPDYLDLPEEWPAWVREQVNANRPTGV
ncbi:hypothetical protein ACWD4O_38680 [Streptomyces sp. NPDC002623]